MGKHKGEQHAHKKCDGAARERKATAPKPEKKKE
jgi:hypothetical protein